MTVSTTSTVPVVQQLLSSSSNKGRDIAVPVNGSMVNGSDGGIRLDPSLETVQYTLVRLVGLKMVNQSTAFSFFPNQCTDENDVVSFPCEK